MKTITIIFMLFCTIKSVFYAKYEFIENNNKSGGIAVTFLAVLGLILNTYLIFI